MVSERELCLSSGVPCATAVSKLVFRYSVANLRSVSETGRSKTRSFPPCQQTPRTTRSRSDTGFPFILIIPMDLQQATPTPLIGILTRPRALPTRNNSVSVVSPSRGRSNHRQLRARKSPCTTCSSIVRISRGRPRPTLSRVGPVLSRRRLVPFRHTREEESCGRKRTSTRILRRHRTSVRVRQARRRRRTNRTLPRRGNTKLHRRSLRNSTSRTSRGLSTLLHPRPESAPSQQTVQPEISSFHRCQVC